ncbi:hypothetical protein KY338_04845 [Candidatus Woesearchaeota archaeon]|nr:hypothetical protein [Candidatus Woesearchaeota archaeon]MBW3006232.1 hypothetical protein [Candidatus Woesearchaeota archaeon]
MKKANNKTFIRFLRTKKYKIGDFIEPLLVLPFAYGMLLLPGGLDKMELITWLALAFVYAPIAYFIITRRRE